MTDNKQQLREMIWKKLQESADDRFPGAEGRIPNFKGREDAAERLCESPAYRSADTIKINPDSPQTPVRERALEDGKTLYMAVPKLSDRKCFLELDPATLSGTPSDWSSIKGASEHGTPVHPESMREIDLIVTGVVGVDSEGRRLGKGGGYSDLEFAVLLHYNRINRTIPILTILHPVQELETGRIPRESQDITLSGYFTPEKSTNIENPLPRPEGIDVKKLDDEQVRSIPILSEILSERSDLTKKTPGDSH